jgi:magnesium chelatase family protein
MAAAVLAQLGRVPGPALDGTALIGELALDGRVRPVPGVLPSAASLACGDVRRLVVADENAAEAALVAAGEADGQSLEVLQVAHLGELLGLLQGARPRPIAPPAPVKPAGR